MKVAFTSIGALAIVSIAACSGGAGQATNLRGGPDGVPKSSTDSPGNGNESPGSSNQDSPGTSEQNSAGNCLTCSGTYQCSSSSSGQTSTSYISLGPASGGCEVLQTGNTASDVLQCGGKFVEIQNGSTTLIGQWSGGDGSFVVSATIDGQTLTVTCTASTQAQPQPGGTTDTVDAG